jgi:hypothetical protein
VTKLPTFHEWFNATRAAALATPVGVRLASLGFDLQHTGGGCLAWELPRGNDAVWIADDGCGIESASEALEWGATLIVGEGDDFISGPQDVNLETAIEWALQQKESNS